MSKIKILLFLILLSQFINMLNNELNNSIIKSDLDPPHERPFTDSLL